MILCSLRLNLIIVLKIMDLLSIMAVDIDVFCLRNRMVFQSLLDHHYKINVSYVCIKIGFIIRNVKPSMDTIDNRLLNNFKTFSFHQTIAQLPRRRR